MGNCHLLKSSLCHGDLLLVYALSWSDSSPGYQWKTKLPSTLFQLTLCAVRHGPCLSPPCQCQSIPPPLHAHYSPGGPWSPSLPFVFLPHSSGESFPANGYAAPMGEPTPYQSLAFSFFFCRQVWNVEWAYSAFIFEPEVNLNAEINTKVFHVLDIFIDFIYIKVL